MELTCNFSGNIQPQSSQPAKPLWTYPGIKSGISLCKLISTLKKKKEKKVQAGNETANILPTSLQVRIEPPPLSGDGRGVLTWCLLIMGQFICVISGWLWWLEVCSLWNKLSVLSVGGFGDLRSAHYRASYLCLSRPWSTTRHCCMTDWLWCHHGTVCCVW